LERGFGWVVAMREGRGVIVGGWWKGVGRFS
jgi:hypothetical protein